MGNGEEKMGNFEKQFRAFAKNGKYITMEQSDKWMKQAKIVGKYTPIKQSDTSTHFTNLKKSKIDFAEYNKFLEELAKSKNIQLWELIKRLTCCGKPQIVTVCISLNI